MFIVLSFTPLLSVVISVLLWESGFISGWLSIIFAVTLIALSFSIFCNYSYRIGVSDLEEHNDKLSKDLSSQRDENNKHIQHIKHLESDIKLYKEKAESLYEIVAIEKNHYSSMLSGQIKAFPYLSGMIADYILLEDERNNNYNGRSKTLLERKLRITDLIREKKQLIAQQRETAYKLDFLLAAFPELEDFLDTDYRDMQTTFDYHDHDPAKDYLSKEEWQSLSVSERNQLALDRYVESHSKSKWQIGRDYELSVGHMYLQQGFKVDFTGTTQKYDDLGRDLVATKGKKVYIIQCKYWSQDKVIHEKHIFQLYGTSYCYQLDHPEFEVIPVFVTNIDFSSTARKFAKALNVTLVKNYPLNDFPRIKCNIGKDPDGGASMIYHLPMDQQYDSVVIDKPGECYALTVQEAEAMGFRRAYKWHA